MRFYPILEEGRSDDLVSLVLILGILIAFLLNIVVNGFILAFWLQRKPVWKHLPKWLLITNFLFLFPEIILFLK
ncbi:hypothetical protein A4H97_32500 [Niastella yeongjuensis]|uniref:Uncharacterized protein n=1 Tax=Niastella yeongjuensis TaxID=354355 RepID=A0A1V9EH72_9BACT|nr:hypothetical protein A4H97_32500 [Niastella yeongjuensis]